MKTSIVGDGIVIRNKKILLIKDDERGWKTPGGRLDPGETLEEGTLRELKEEISSDAKIIDFLCTSNVIHKRTKYVIFNYRVRLLQEPKPGNEVKSLGWYNYQQCSKMLLSLNSRNVVEFLHKKGEL